MKLLEPPYSFQNHNSQEIGNIVDKDGNRVASAVYIREAEFIIEACNYCFNTMFKKESHDK